MRVIATTTILILFVAVVIAELDYGIIIDAGSSGSRIYLYQWDHRDNNTLPLVAPATINQTVISKKINTPLANFASNPNQAGESLGPLIDYIKVSLVQSKWSSTPIYLKATAGMRAISLSDQATIIADVRTYLAATPFLFEPDYAKVIPGTDEGVFGWITVNFALNVYTSSSNPVTFGALDMGGASTQITFVPQNSPTSNSFNLSLNAVDYSLYAYSYPLGQDQANRLVLSGLLADGKTDDQGNILNPCYLIGYNETYLTGPTLVFGTSNYTACQEVTHKYVVTTDPSCQSCGIGSVYQPPVYGHYYAFSGFAYTCAFLGLPSTATIADLNAAGSAYCSSTFSEARVAHPTEQDIYIRIYCFTSVYLSEVLTQYGFATGGNDLTIQTSIGNIELTWALGGMIYEANLLPFGYISAASPLYFSGVLYFIVIIVSMVLL